MDTEIRQTLAKMYTFLRRQQEAILEIHTALQAVQMTAISNPSFATRYQEELADARASSLTQAHVLLLGLIDLEIQELGGKAPDPPLPQA